MKGCERRGSALGGPTAAAAAAASGWALGGGPRLRGGRLRAARLLPVGRAARLRPGGRRFREAGRARQLSGAAAAFPRTARDGDGAQRGARVQAPAALPSIHHPPARPQTHQPKTLPNPVLCQTSGQTPVFSRHQESPHRPTCKPSARHAAQSEGRIAHNHGRAPAGSQLQVNATQADAGVAESRGTAGGA